MNTEDRIKLFANELYDITEPNLSEFAKSLLIEADDYFYKIAASTSGKYHPQFDLGDGGLVRHTRCVAFFAKSLAESLNLSSHEKNLLIVAAIAHDIKKLGNGGSKHTVNDHPQIAAEFVREISDKYANLISIEDREIIAGCVKSHMGKWSTQYGMPMPETELEKALQAADYIASRKEILDFNFRPTEDVEFDADAQIEPQSAFNGDLKDYVLQFGKHKGETLEQARPSGYLDWMVKQEDFFNKEAQENARLYLESLRGTKKEVIKEIKPVNVILPEAETEIDDLPF